MTLRKYMTEDIEKYSFIDSAEIKEGKIIVKYTTPSGQKEKKIPMRTSIEKLQKILIKIRKKVGVSIYGKGEHGTIYTSGD